LILWNLVNNLRLTKKNNVNAREYHQVPWPDSENLKELGATAGIEPVTGVL